MYTAVQAIPTLRVSPWTRALTGNDPFRRVFERLADDIAEPMLGTPTRRIQAVEEDDRFLVRAEMPGVDENDIQLSVHDRILEIRATRPAPMGRGTMLRGEIGEMTLHKTVRLNAAVVADDVTATLNNGVLMVDLPKVPAATPRTIAVQSA